MMKPCHGRSHPMARNCTSASTPLFSTPCDGTPTGNSSRCRSFAALIASSWRYLAAATVGGRLRRCKPAVRRDSSPRLLELLALLPRRTAGSRTALSLPPGSAKAAEAASKTPPEFLSHREVVLLTAAARGALDAALGREEVVGDGGRVFEHVDVVLPGLREPRRRRRR
ncbi:hypothetical protein DL89DRAFT_13924 [Linderina pennispora]|uniref:Uncharacterized protein n=1 Tax=Linderina pennispora TaxID=61395 RepID=A0A1Y1WMA6_9FUNG|nr:uncharacterized protein DL89DRAFT_13924 [Linderina pennispora]ORX74326.1 hypothetical protein DL89DRAFT_13924 [Linderina pennispora]